MSESPRDVHRLAAVPLAACSIIVVTTAVFILQHFHPGGIHGAIEQWGSVPERIFDKGALHGGDIDSRMGLFTALFIHSSWTHLGGNMAVLLVLSLGLERVLGRLRFVVLYFAAGWLGLVAEALLHANSTKPMCGASVAVAGVWLVWLLLARQSLKHTLPLAPTAKHATKLLRKFLLALTIFIAAWAGISWFGNDLLTAITGAGTRVFWSRSFCGHLFGALAGGFVFVIYQFTSCLQTEVRKA